MISSVIKCGQSRAGSFLDSSNMNCITCRFEHADHAHVPTLILLGRFLIV